MRQAAPTCCCADICPLLFFEFLVLLLHPLIESLVDHNKVLELLVLVVIGAGLVPLHHRLESLVITKLTSHHLNKETIVVAEKESSKTLEKVNS